MIANACVTFDFRNDMEEIDRIICMIENVGLNATRHQDQEKAMTEANEIRKHLEALVSKNESLNLVSKPLYCADTDKTGNCFDSGFSQCEECKK